MSDIQIFHVTQPTPTTCVHACLSMVTGIPIEDLVERFGDDYGLSTDEEVTVLTEMGILPVAVPEQLGSWVCAVGVYFVDTPSLNLVGHSHRVVVEQYVSDGEWALRVFDPNVGRAGAKAHGENALFQPRTMISYGSLTRLVPMRLHHGTRERLQLYRKRLEARVSPRPREAA